MMCFWSDQCKPHEYDDLQDLWLEIFPLQFDAFLFY